MRCYFAFSEPDRNNLIYLELLRTAIKSARDNTTLDLVSLYDPAGHVIDESNPEALPEGFKILKHYGVKVIIHEFSRKADLFSTFTDDFLKRHINRLIPIEKISGTMMRLDIPFIETENEAVLYADIDVIFLKDIKDGDITVPKVLSVAPEIDQHREISDFFNAGVLYMNVRAMRQKVSLIYEKLSRGEPPNISLFDQGYLIEVCKDEVERLPEMYNWKPYWGINPDAKIVHFHGLKPGGDYLNSGFNFNKDTFIRLLAGHEKDISGILYYFNIFFSILGRDEKLWTSNIIGDIFEAFISSTNTNIKKIPVYVPKIEKMTIDSIVNSDLRTKDIFSALFKRVVFRLKHRYLKIK